VVCTDRVALAVIPAAVPDDGSDPTVAPSLASTRSPSLGVCPGKRERSPG
jgi:hypothetical protein